MHKSDGVLVQGCHTGGVGGVGWGEVSGVGWGGVG